jgi:hypothetical protein
MRERKNEDLRVRDLNRLKAAAAAAAAGED